MKVLTPRRFVAAIATGLLVLGAAILASLAIGPSGISVGDALRVLAGAGHAGFFSRFDIMRAWAEAGTVDVERTARDRRTAEIDKLNDCLARALAAFIRDGVEEARR